MDSSRSLASSYLMPYTETPKEPTLVIPMIPDLGPPPEPVPPRRPPPPGYDMKTLRRQVDYLQEEINSRVENYNAVCGQNEKLFAYVQELVRANDFNVNNMRDYCRKVHEEMRMVKRERAQLVEKLEFMVNSKRLLADLSEDLKEAQVSAEETVRRKQEVELSLFQAVEERRLAEYELQEKVEKMKDYESLLDRYKEQSRELQSLEMADDFFLHNHKILKSAYSRFKQGVTKRMRQQKLHELFTRLYRKHLKIVCWRRWMEFRHRHRVMVRNRLRRQFECLSLMFKRWKVMAAYEHLINRSRRLRLLRVGFDLLIRHHQLVKYDQWAAETTLEWKATVLMRKIFAAWKTNTMFLDWFAPWTLAKNDFAGKFRLKRILAAWREVSAEKHHYYQQLTHYVHLHKAHKHLFEWRFLCQRQWKYRGRLLRRFLQVLRQNLSTKTFYLGLERKATMFYLHHGKKMLFQRWRNVLIERKCRMQMVAPLVTLTCTNKTLQNTLKTTISEKLGMSQLFNSQQTLNSKSLQLDILLMTPKRTLHRDESSNIFFTNGMEDHRNQPYDTFSHTSYHSQDYLDRDRVISEDYGHDLNDLQVTENMLRQRRHRQTLFVLSHYHRRLLRHQFGAWQTKILQRKECRLLGKLAVRHEKHVVVHRVYRSLQEQVWHKKEQRTKIFLLRQFHGLRRWQKYVQHKQYQGRLIQGLQQLKEKHVLQVLGGMWQLWMVQAKKEKRLRRTASYVMERCMLSLRHRHWQRWHSYYLSRLVWKSKELTIDINRMQALQSLQVQSLQEKTDECLQWQRATSEMMQEVARLRTNVTAQEKQVLAYETDIQVQEKQRQQLEAHLQTLQEKLKDMEAQQVRWQALESSIQRERLLEKQERAKKYALVTQQIDVLQQAYKASQAEETRRQLRLQQVRDITKAQVTQATLQYTEAVDDVQTLTEEIHAQEAQVSQLQQEQEVMFQELTSVKAKIRDVVQEAQALQEEQEKQLRQQMAQNDVLKADAGVAQARVMAMLELVEEASRDKSLMKLQEIESSELRELQEMNQLRTMFQDKLHSLEQKYIQTHLNSTSSHGQGTIVRPSYSERKSPLSSPSNTLQRLVIPLSTTSNNKFDRYENKDSEKSIIGGMEDSMRMQQLYERLAHSPLRNSANSSVEITGNDLNHSVNKGINNNANTSFSQVPVRLFANNSTINPGGNSVNNSTVSSSPLLEETKRLDRHYADAREAIRSLTSRLSRPLPTDTL